MPELHSSVCCCPACSQPRRQDDDAVRTSVEAAAKPSYSSTEVVETLTTSGSTRSSRAWADNTVSYAIGIGQLGQSHPDYTFEHDGYVAMTTAMEAAAREAFELWDEVLAISLVERVNDPGADVTFNYTSASYGSTYARVVYANQNNQPRSETVLRESDIWLAHDWRTHNQDSDLYLGGYGIQTYLHEVGHALGLSHPGAYNGSASFGSDADYYQDTRQYTVMSYFDADENGSGVDHIGSRGRSFAATPLLHDIMVLQAVYGADTSTRTGNTTYGFNANANRDAFDFTKNPDPVVAIWDAGGIDRLDLSGFGTDQRINLNEGAFSDAGSLTGNIAIAFGTVIEQARGGGGSDRITGNDADNWLHGNPGPDLIVGGRGRDTLIGGSDSDILEGGRGADTLDGRGGEDTVRFVGASSGVEMSLADQSGSKGDAAGDVYIGVERIRGSAYDDTLTGSNGANQIRGGEGNDVLRGLGGQDFILGGPGDDTLIGGATNDILRGGEGADRLIGDQQRDWAQYVAATSGVVVDLVQGGSGGEAAGDVFISVENVRGSDFADVLNGTNGNNLISGEAGDDTLRGRDGSDILRGHDGEDRIRGGAGKDVLIGGKGADDLNGRDGNDWADYQDASGAVDISLARGDGKGSDAGGDVYSNIEWLWGGAFDDRIEGDEGVNMLRGGAGDDTIIGNGGKDYLTGHTGADTFVFGPDDSIDRIQDFDTGTDTIRFVDGAASRFSDLRITDFRGDAAVAYDPGDTVLLIGIAPGDVEESMFIFG